MMVPLRDVLEEVRQDVKELRADVHHIKVSIPHFVTWAKLGGVATALIAAAAGLRALVG